MGDRTRPQDHAGRLYLAELGRLRDQVRRSADDVTRHLGQVRAALDVGTVPDLSTLRNLAVYAGELAQQGYALHALDQFAFIVGDETPPAHDGGLRDD